MKEMIIDINELILERKTLNDLSYIEIICEICEEKDIDIESIKKHLSKAILEKLEAEFARLRMFKDIKEENTLDELF